MLAYWYIAVKLTSSHEYKEGLLEKLLLEFYNISSSKRNCMMISTDDEKAFDIIQYPYLIVKAKSGK